MDGDRINISIKSPTGSYQGIEVNVTTGYQADYYTNETLFELFKNALENDPNTDVKVQEGLLYRLTQTDLMSQPPSE